jgi:hypothetical protein
VTASLWFVLMLSVLACALLAFRRATELFVGKFRSGEFQLHRGRCPARLRDELADIGRLEKLDSVVLSVRSEAARPRVTATGKISDGQLQQLRNVVGRFEVSQIRRG